MALNTPDNRNDFYDGFNDASGQQDSTRMRIDFTRSDFPKTWWPQTPKLLEALRKKHEAEVAAIENLAGRRLSQTEYEGMAYWSAKEAQIRSRGLLIGVTLDQAYRTRKQFRFPFWKPSEGFDFNSIRIGSQKIVEGQLARTFWSIARFSAYGAIVGPFLGIMLCTSWGISTSNLGRLQDPRTKPLMAEIFKKAQETRAQRMQQVASQNTNRDISQRTQSPFPTSSDTGSPVNDTYNESTFQDDAYSPQSSQNSSDMASYGMSNSSSNLMPFPPPTRNRQPSNPAHTDPDPVSRQSEEPSQFFDNDYDDASPTASYPSTSSSGRSAWDKVRAGSSTTPGRPPKQQNASNTGRIDYTPPAQVDTRSQAQKDFDDSIERERQGRNFD